MTKPCLLLALLGLLSTSGCKKDDDMRPANYDILAMETGHWEWDNTSFFLTRFTPDTEGYSRQLTFTDSRQATVRQLLLRRANQPDQFIPYQLSVGAGGSPTLTYNTSEGRWTNNDVKLYRITQQNGQQILQLTGEKAASDAGGYETYHWVKE
ncbi:MAG: hypothetical protein EOO56_02230 [Hymenobacter sp.]|nr:MAG: hypothetical protein EOO56_02230 [Hymenobacter sp.]